MSKGRFGIHGGQYIPETLMNAVLELEEAYNHYKNDPEFNRELTELLNEYAGRPSRLYYAAHMTEDLGGAKIYLKREDLNHTGAHKINNVLGQVLLAKKMGKTRVIAETGAGQHGVATATAAALMGLECEIFMGKEDTDRQALNVFRMELLGAKVHAVTSGTMTLKDAVNETMREWSKRMDDTLYVLGSVMGPHPFPTIVRDFQKIIGEEIKEQLIEKEGRLPDAVIACVGGGSNAIGTFYEFIPDKEVVLIGCEAAGLGIDTPKHAATIAKGSTGIFHGMKSLFCQDEYGQIAPVYSISAGLDYPGIGPEHHRGQAQALLPQLRHQAAHGGGFARVFTETNHRHRRGIPHQGRQKLFQKTASLPCSFWAVCHRHYKSPARILSMGEKRPAGETALAGKQGELRRILQFNVK